MNTTHSVIQTTTGDKPHSAAIDTTEQQLGKYCIMECFTGKFTVTTDRCSDKGDMQDYSDVYLELVQVHNNSLQNVKCEQQ
jgi:hypothetical protein